MEGYEGRLASLAADLTQLLQDNRTMHEALQRVDKAQHATRPMVENIVAEAESLKKDVAMSQLDSYLRYGSRGMEAPKVAVRAVESDSFLQQRIDALRLELNRVRDAKEKVTEEARRWKELAKRREGGPGVSTLRQSAERSAAQAESFRQLAEDRGRIIHELNDTITDQKNGIQDLQSRELRLQELNRCMVNDREAARRDAERFRVRCWELIQRVAELEGRPVSPDYQGSRKPVDSRSNTDYNQATSKRSDEYPGR